MRHTLVTLAEHPELEEQLVAFHKALLPPFMLKYAVDDQYQQTLLHYFPDYQLALHDAQDQVIAVGNSIPITWDGTVQGLPEGWDAGFEQSISEHERHVQPTALMATGICIDPSFRGQALSSQLLQAMLQLAVTHTLQNLIVPVRPTFKHRYPLIAMDEYAFWTREDSLPFDPWMRVHARLGAKILKIAPCSTVITGTIQEWEEWTGIHMPQSGSYLIPEALVPVTISYERNEGRYEEPNVWMQHAISVHSSSTTNI